MNHRTSALALAALLLTIAAPTRAEEPGGAVIDPGGTGRWNHPLADAPPEWTGRTPMKHLPATDFGFFILPSEFGVPLLVTNDPLGTSKLGYGGASTRLPFALGWRFGYSPGRWGLDVGLRYANFGVRAGLKEVHAPVAVDAPELQSYALDVGAHWKAVASGSLIPVLAAHAGVSLWQIPLHARPDGSVGSSSGAYTPLVAATAALRWIVGGAATAEGRGEVGASAAFVLTAGVRVEATLTSDLAGHGAVFERPVITVLPYLGMAFWRVGGWAMRPNAFASVRLCCLVGLLSSCSQAPCGTSAACRDAAESKIRENAALVDSDPYAASRRIADDFERACDLGDADACRTALSYWLRRRHDAGNPRARRDACVHATSQEPDSPASAAECAPHLTRNYARLTSL